MEIERKGLGLLAVLILQCIVVYSHGEVNRKAIGKLESRRILNELRRRHAAHVFKRSIASLRQEETDTEEEEETDTKYNGHSVDGVKLLEDALKGKVDPDSEVVNILESMYVDDGKKHNAHPDGIAEIASKKGKVYGDTHDSHKLTKQEMNDLQDSGTGGRRRRNFLTSAPLWTDKIIPYTIASSLSTQQSYVDVINVAIQQFTDYTCLKWVPYGSTEANKASYSSYIEFFSESGCWSYVGRVFSDKQQISLQAPGCVTLSTTIHEMTHAIGQMHEQSRSDRDNHVTMFWDNINGGSSNYNMIKSGTHDNNPYDYESVLQYSLTAFSTNGKPTIEFSDRRLDFLADSATGLMFYDIKDITDGYGCTEPCKGDNGDIPLKQCQNGGFVIHNCNCHCPGGLTGTLCETVITDAECGPGIITLTEEENRTLTSPNFNDGGPYPTGKNCVWLIKVPDGKHVHMTINEMDLTTNNGACNHWLEIQYNLIGQTGPRRCGNFSEETYMTSIYGDPTMMLLKFDSAFAATATAGKGFSLTLTAVGPGCALAPCVHGTCTAVGTSNFTCNCPTGFSGPLCETVESTVIISCDFESDTSCIFSNTNTGDQRDWTITSGSTPSSSTGPSGAQSGNNYLYAETSSPVVTGDKFFFETPVIPGAQRCLTFWYHMYGSSMGTLNVLVDGSSVWTRTGDQGNSWKQADVNITTTTDYKVTFEAIRGSSWASDIAVDAISLTPCESGSSTTQAPTTQAPTTQAPTTQASTTQAPTTQAPTTPPPTTPPPPTTQAPTTRQSTTQTTTQTTTIILPTQAPTTQAPTTQAPTTQAPTTPPPTTPPTTQAPTTRQSTTQTTTIILPTHHPSTEEPTLVDQELHCTFESGEFCFLENILGDNFNWTNRQGKTPSSNTGPASAFEGTMYSYIEATSKAIDSYASLQSATVSTTDHWKGQCDSGEQCSPWTSCFKDLQFCRYDTMKNQHNDDPCICQPFCLSFAYHMYGSNIGSLSVLMVSSTTSLTLFDESGNKGNQWNVAYISVPPTTGQIEFTAVRGDSFRGDIAIDDVHFLSGDCVIPSTTTPAPLTLPLSCTFESGTCFLQDVTSSDFLWSRKSGGTPSEQTGPTSAFEGIWYTYIETSGKAIGDIAVLESSPVLTVDPFMCLSFAYHMYGNHIGSLEVVYNNATVFNEFGNKGNQWNQAQITIPASQSSASTIQFVGTRGSGFKGDIAIDDIQVITGECVIPSTTTPAPLTLPLSCTFESGTCFLQDVTSTDDFNWSRRSGTTPSQNTGPTSAFEGTWYTYIETSGKAIGDIAVLESSPVLTGDPFMCLSFAYHMYGSNIGSLEVVYNYTAVFNEFGNKGNQWNQAKVTLPASQSSESTIQFVGTRGSGFRGDIAIDDIQVTTGECVIPSTTTSAPLTLPLSCTFESGTTCFLQDVTSTDDFNWSRRSGTTPSQNTGPTSAFEGTWYTYIETSGKAVGDIAVLESLPVLTGDPFMCLSFAYHMYGSNIGSLEVVYNNTAVFNESGNKGNQWNQVEVTLPASQSSESTIQFVGTRGTGYRGDIAIDNIQVITGECDLS